MKFFTSLIFYFVCITVLVYSDACLRPDILLEKMELCWSSEVEILDRMKQTSKSVLNFAKKTFGVGEIEKDEPQKCEYYQCVFRELHMLNANGFPVTQSIKEWSEKYATFNQVLEFSNQLNKCNDALTDSQLNGHTFLADNVGSDQPIENKDDIQTNCEVTAEFMKCLNKNQKCPIFVYP